MSQSSERTFLQNRLQQEHAAAGRAEGKSARLIHLVLADSYHQRLMILGEARIGIPPIP